MRNSATSTPDIIRAAMLVVLVFASGAFAQTATNPLYDQIADFHLDSGKTDVNGLVLKRDRVEMTLTGSLYFSSPIEGKVTGAVFIGDGSIRAAVPGSGFEKANVKRLLGMDDVIESDFKTAVFRFSDDSYDLMHGNMTPGEAPPQAQALAAEVSSRILKETGANLSARIAISISNHETPGVFFANFDGGKRGRFSFLFDPQMRIPTNSFGVNGGEKGLLFKYDASNLDNDVWMAFYSLADYAQGIASYSDIGDLIDVTNYDMRIDLRQPKKAMALRARISVVSKVEGLRAINFNIGEGLTEADDVRLKKQMRIKAAHVGDAEVPVTQENWEGGFTVFLLHPLGLAESTVLDLDLEGDFLQQPDAQPDCSYPRSNDSWYPRHGYLDRSTFSFTFRHQKKYKVASTGMRISEGPDPDDKDMVITKYVMSYPVALETFALGPFERHTQTIKWENGDKPTPLEFNSLSTLVLKESFVLAELDNAVRNFQFLFGKYPYESFSAVYHPFGFGQGFATMLTIPNTDRDNKAAFAFMAHETAHQWWGNIVSWRSYRDQWLSEGFAEYSGVIYTGRRDGPTSAAHLIDEMRKSLKDPPVSTNGFGKGRLVDVGPLILGRRLETKKTRGAYTTLVYSKGALVLRMIHFLMTDPSTGNGQPFFDMMKDFVERYRDKVASTDDFRMVANEHFARTPLAKKYGINNLDWFFRQWVYDTPLPSYHLAYTVEDQPDGTSVVSGTVTQDNAPKNWFMPLPVVFKFSDKELAYGTVAVVGPSQAFSIRLPKHPQSVELDPNRWVLSEKTSTN
jgi:hypothetical protein